MSQDARKLRLVYMGTPDFAVASLRALVEGGYNVVGVVTAMDKPAGRGLKLQQSAVKQYATSVGLPVLQPEKLKAPEFIEQFKSLDADLGIVIAFRMLPEVIWSNPRLGTFNLHASLLPDYRGAAPINWAVINGEKTTGVTTFMLNHEIDKGDVLGRVEVPIEDDDSAGTLHDRLMGVGVELVTQTVDKIACAGVVAIDQRTLETETVKDAPKIFKNDCRIDWTVGSRRINNLIRGLSPYPTAWCMAHLITEEEVSVKIFGAHTGGNQPAESCGTVLSDGKTYLKVACCDGYIFIDELQVAGKKRIKTEEFLRGAKPFVSCS